MEVNPQHLSLADLIAIGTAGVERAKHLIGKHGHLSQKERESMPREQATTMLQALIDVGSVDAQAARHYVATGQHFDPNAVPAPVCSEQFLANLTPEPGSPVAAGSPSSAGGPTATEIEAAAAAAFGTDGYSPNSGPIPGASNRGKPWSNEDDTALMRGFAVDNKDQQQLARTFGRTAYGIVMRLQKLGLLDKNGNKVHSKINDVRRRFGATPAPAVTPRPSVQSIVIDDTINAGMTAAQFSQLAQPLFSKPPEFEKPKLDQKPPVAVPPVFDMDAIRKLITDEVAKYAGAIVKIEVEQPDGTVIQTSGLQHYAFPKLLRAVKARTRHDKNALNVWLYGPAGTGKSTAARKLAEALGLAFHTNGPVGSQWDIRGFTDAQGKVVDTAFRRAWEGGGVYCWDEGDGSAPSALIEANGALATGFASFPDKVVRRHANCVVVINGNLRPGAAPDATYNGRFKQDTAFVNRFVAIEWGIDEILERALLGDLKGDHQRFYNYTIKARKAVKDRGVKGVVISPRQLQYGMALLDVGAPLDEVKEQTLKFMFTDEQWREIDKAAA